MRAWPSATRLSPINSDDDDPEAFLFTVQDGGATTSYVVPWCDGFEFDRTDTKGVQFGR